MFNRHAKLNIPTELLRALVTLKDCGSYTRAAELLNLTQPAISSQIGRLKIILGGELFQKGLGLTLTRRGTLALSYARRILAMHDQLITVVGPNPAPRQVLIGMPRWFNYRRIIEVIRTCSAGVIEDRVSFRCDESEGLLRDLSAGTLDLAFICNAHEPPTARHRGVVGAPLLGEVAGARADARRRHPVGELPGTLPDRLATKLLDAANLRYEIAFSGPEHASRKAAVAAGLGIMLMPERVMTPEMEIARDAYLPKPPTVRTGLFMRDGLDVRSLKPLVEVLEEVLRPRQAQPPILPSPRKPKRKRALRRQPA